jgi:hypothetical protein
MSKQINAVEMISAERRRQVEVEGWGQSHDDGHTDGSLAEAAGCYALAERMREFWGGDPIPDEWPWEDGWWKPTPNDRIRELVKAGALIVAEIERLQRAGPGKEGT